MLKPWNNSSLLPPPVNMFLCKKKFDLPSLKHVTNNIMKVLSKQSPLHKESAICSRFLYKYDKKFRNDIGYRNLRKVNTALKKYLALNLLKDVENFFLALPSEVETDLYLPTRQMLEYLLLRIIAFAKIMVRVSVCAKQAAVFYLDRIKRGESHWMSLLPYALLSRLWSMSMVLVQHSTTWYSNLYAYIDQLELKGLNLLPDDYELPKDLDEWLDLKNIDNFGRFDWAQSKDIDVDNALLDDDENDLFDNILGYVNQINKEESDPDEITEPVLNKKDVIIPMLTDTTIDHGEVLSRESFKVLNSNKSKAEEITPNKTHKVDHGEILSRESFKVLHSNKKMKDFSTKLNNKTELGETLSRETFKMLATSKEETKSNNQNSQKTTKKVSDHTHKNVTNTDSLKKFIECEEKYRNDSDSKSLTSHLSLMQWHALKNSLTKLTDSITNRKIDKKFQKIWKQKCLHYL